MKRFILLCAFLSTGLSIYGQTNEFAPVGAKWWYGIQDEITGQISYRLYEAEKDTIIDGIQAIKISLTNVEPDGSSVLIASEYFAHDTSKLSIYRNETFIDIINYNVEIGDTVIVFDETFNGFFDFSIYTYEYFAYVINSITLENYNSHLIKTFYIDNMTESDYSFENMFSPTPIFLQNIGSIEDFCFIGIPNDISTTGIPLGLICYETDSINISFNNQSCDSILNDISIVGNPTVSFNVSYSDRLININTNDNKHYTIAIANINQQIILWGDFYRSFSVNPSLYPDGTYILMILNDDNNLVFSEKIML